MKNEHPRLLDESTTSWLSLSAAAAYLGIHFTTLRRWCAAGKITCVLTPGGQRRFSIDDLQNFLEQSRKPEPAHAMPAAAMDLRPEMSGMKIREVIAHEPWLPKINEIQQIKLRGAGQMLWGLMMQYVVRAEGGEIFLIEAQQIARLIGHECSCAGMSITETVHAFLIFRKTIINSLFRTSATHSALDETGIQLHQRTNTYLDALLLATVDGFSNCASA